MVSLRFRAQGVGSGELLLNYPDCIYAQTIEVSWAMQVSSRGLRMSPMHPGRRHM